MNEYTSKFNKAWIEAGGLVTPSIASKMLEVSRARIAQMQNEGKLKTYKDNTGKTMLSFHEINTLLIEKNKKSNKILKYRVKYKINEEEREVTMKSKYKAEMKNIMSAITENDKQAKENPENIKNISVEQEIKGFNY